MTPNNKELVRQCVYERNQQHAGTTDDFCRAISMGYTALGNSVYDLIQSMFDGQTTQSFKLIDEIVDHICDVIDDNTDLEQTNVAEATTEILNDCLRAYEDLELRRNSCICG